MDLNSIRALACASALLALSPTAQAQDRPLLHTLFQDRAVLQRERPIPIWGHAAPNETVTVTLGRTRASVRADAQGNWRANLPAQRAGGPFTLTARAASGATQSASDVMIGDVWLCSGQSNMVLQVHRALDSRREIQNSANINIRMLSVPLRASPTPLETFPAPVAWQVAAPAVVPDWSAACYYFVRELRKRVDVPMGMVVSARGSSNIRAWMGDAALRALGYGQGLDLLALSTRDPNAALQQWGAQWEAWYRGKAPDEPWSAARIDARLWRAAPAALDFWKNWGVPELVNFNGLVWYCTAVRLTPAQAAQAATLSLGLIDDVDMSWVNGSPVGYTSDAGTLRQYALPAGALHAGDNLIVVNALNVYDRGKGARGERATTGGMYGPAETRALQLADGTSIPLGNWRYHIAPQEIGRPPLAPWEATGGLSVIRNAMIAPLGPYAFRGAVWYQGEANTNEDLDYQPQLAAMMADWRNQFGAELPFLIVQLAGYGPPSTHPVESNYARVREAQRRAVLADTHAGLAIAIDIGEWTDIHPSNKQELGRRLARAARHVIYGEALAPSGPAIQSARHSGSEIVVSFSDVEHELVTYSADAPIGFELCDQHACRYAAAHIAGTQVFLAIPAGLTPTRVRFCWADSPICTLYDGNGLPAGPFEIPIS